MKQNSIKSITAVSVIIIIFCALSAFIVIGQGIVMFIKPENIGVIWSDENKGLQLLVAIGRPLQGSGLPTWRYSGISTGFQRHTLT